MDRVDDQPVTVRSVARLHSLDGLRGIAAFVVVIHHTLLTRPSLSTVYLHDGPVAHRWTAGWWASWTPLHLLWAGGEAVIVFFVMSGFVLALPCFATKTPDWNAYYPKRLVRLYLPVVAAVAIGIALIKLVHRTSGPSTSTWLGSHPSEVGLVQTFRDVVLVLDAPGGAFTALWSLRWEMLFSLLLPAFVFCCVVARRHPGLLAIMCVGSIGVSVKIDPALSFMPVFLLGCLLADGHARDAAWWKNCAKVARVPGRALLGGSLLFLAARWLPISRLQNVQGGVTEGLLRVAVVLGSVGLLIVALADPEVRRVLEVRPLQWLGTRSFSLYLVHEPIIVTTAFAFGQRAALAWFLPLMVGCCLAAAEIFYRTVEVPSIALARRVQAAAKVWATPAAAG